MQLSDRFEDGSLDGMGAGWTAFARLHMMWSAKIRRRPINECVNPPHPSDSCGYLHDSKLEYHTALGFVDEKSMLEVRPAFPKEKLTDDTSRIL